MARYRGPQLEAAALKVARPALALTTAHEDPATAEARRAGGPCSLARVTEVNEPPPGTAGRNADPKRAPSAPASAAARRAVGAIAREEADGGVGSCRRALAAPRTTSAAWKASLSLRGLTPIIGAEAVKGEARTRLAALQGTRVVAITPLPSRASLRPPVNGANAKGSATFSASIIGTRTTAIASRTHLLTARQAAAGLRNVRSAKAGAAISARVAPAGKASRGTRRPTAISTAEAAAP